jgi:hypothetical protein
MWAKPQHNATVTIRITAIIRTFAESKNAAAFLVSTLENCRSTPASSLIQINDPSLSAQSIRARQWLSSCEGTKNAYSIDEERMIAERSEMVVGGLNLGTVSEATKILRAVRLCATRANSSSSTASVSSARHEVALASLDLIVTLKNPGDQRIDVP